MKIPTSGDRDSVVRAGAAAAREGLRRSQNPHPVQSEDWNNWMDGFDHQTAWLDGGRGVYDPTSDLSTDENTRSQTPAA